MFDTAAGYGASEEVSGQVVEQRGFADRIFWATKVNVARRGGGSADPEAVLAQIERSFRRLRIPVIDLIHVHNMGDPPTQLGILQRLKAEGRVRYIGITTTSESQYDALADVMRNYPLDSIGIDYAVDNRVAEETILPLAQDRGIAVIVYLPFGRSRMWLGSVIGRCRNGPASSTQPPGHSSCSSSSSPIRQSPWPRQARAIPRTWRTISVAARDDCRRLNTSSG